MCHQVSSHLGGPLSGFPMVGLKYVGVVYQSFLLVAVLNYVLCPRVGTQAGFSPMRHSGELNSQFLALQSCTLIY